MEAGWTATEQAPAARNMDTKDGMVGDKGVDWHPLNSRILLLWEGTSRFPHEHT